MYSVPKCVIECNGKNIRGMRGLTLTATLESKLNKAIESCNAAHALLFLFHTLSTLSPFIERVCATRYSLHALKTIIP